jgi:hypothetical protein
MKISMIWTPKGPTICRIPLFPKMLLMLFGSLHKNIDQAF